MTNAEWMKAVSNIFDSNPRNGNLNQTVWLPRPDIEKQLESDLFTRGRHICVDGCSGSGKSSLAITMLQRHKIEYTSVQVGRNMDWHGICKLLVRKPKRSEREIKVSAGGEWKTLFPTGKLDLSWGRKVDEKAEYEYWEKLVASATEHDIARAICEQECVLLLDEFERAQPNLANSISEVCKILTQSFPSLFGKVIVLGADDSYKKLYDTYSTLDNRLTQISIPTLPNCRQSWEYLKKGFEKLNKFHPGNSKFSKPDEERQCIEAVYNAADGLFKSLTELGVEICRQVGPDTRGIRKSHIEAVCSRIEERNFARYRQKFSIIHRLASSNPVTIAVMICLNKMGLGQVHRREDIESALSTYSRAQIEDAIIALWKEDFLVITGDSNQILFIKNPSWAHTLRVYLATPEKKRRLEAYLDKPMQLMLNLPVDWSELETDSSSQD